MLSCGPWSIPEVFAILVSSMPSNSQSRKGRSGLIFSLALMLVLGAGWLFRDDVSDWWRLRDYDPSAEIVALADQTTMTESARRQFYVTHPDITDREAFNANCRQGNASEYSIVLGCYVSNGGLYGNMYLYDIDDPRLSGVVQVTAAHEMLHAAYDRLSSDEQARVDALLMQTYRDLPDGRIKQTIAQYEANDPSSVPSELHSILGTELASLPPELEDYYSRYFTDRQAVVRFSAQYEGEFERRQAQVAQYDAQLAAAKATIDANEAEINAQLANLEQEKAELSALESSGNGVAYNARVGPYNQAVGSYNALVAETRAQIESYNALVDIRNELALEVEELTKAIDSRPESL